MYLPQCDFFQFCRNFRSILANSSNDCYPMNFHLMLYNVHRCEPIGHCNISSRIIYMSTHSFLKFFLQPTRTLLFHDGLVSLECNCKSHSGPDYKPHFILYIETWRVAVLTVLYEAFKRKF